MNKVPRFVKEYANYQKNIAHTLPNKETEKNIVVSINRTISMLARGMITVNEAMENIHNCFKQN